MKSAFENSSQGATKPREQSREKVIEKPHRVSLTPENDPQQQSSGH